jgi:hypothetical protein
MPFWVVEINCVKVKIMKLLYYFEVQVLVSYKSMCVCVCVCVFFFWVCPLHLLFFYSFLQLWPKQGELLLLVS